MYMRLTETSSVQCYKKKKKTDSWENLEFSVHSPHKVKVPRTPLGASLACCSSDSFGLSSTWLQQTYCLLAQIWYFPLFMCFQICFYICKYATKLKRFPFDCLSNWHGVLFWKFAWTLCRTWLPASSSRSVQRYMGCLRYPSKLEQPCIPLGA